MSTLIWLPYVCRGYGVRHADPETDSDGDGGIAPKLTGRGHIEFSAKGIPHGSLHFPEQLKWAGHMYMHDTSAPEASHRTNIKKCMDRVKKDDDAKTAESMIGWRLRVGTWDKIIREVNRGPGTRVARARKCKPGIINNTSKMLSPTEPLMLLSCLRRGPSHHCVPGATI